MPSASTRRFKSSIVDSDRYALACHRYIEDNPVRAALARHPGEWLWSSFSANGSGIECPFLTPHPALLSLGDDSVSRRNAYRAMFESAQAVREIELLRAAVNTNRPAGSPDFLERLARTFGRPVAARNRSREMSGK